MQQKADKMKRNIENAYDFSFKKAFSAIDDWNYGYCDQQNLKRFLRNMGHVSTKQELIAVLRRYDIDGDAKINFKEFELGLRSTLTTFGPKAGNKKRPKSSAIYQSMPGKLTRSRSLSNISAGKTPKQGKRAKRDMTPLK